MICGLIYRGDNDSIMASRSAVNEYNNSQVCILIDLNTHNPVKQHPTMIVHLMYLLSLGFGSFRCSIMEVPYTHSMLLVVLIAVHQWRSIAY